jgi:hypothetical protein
MNKVALIILLSFFVITTYAQNFYVDDALGNNNNTGASLATPWKTIQHAMDNATPGSNVNIRNGTYYEALEMNVSGTSGNPITFTNYNGENVFIDGNNTAVTLLYIASKTDLIIKGLVFQNTLGNNSAGVLIQGKSKNIIFRKNKIQHINWTASAATIPNSNKNSNPFLVYGTNAITAISNLTIDSNEVSDNITGFSESLTLDGNVDGFTIANNLVHDNVNIGILCAGNYKVSSDPSTDHARNGVVQNNTVYNCVSNYATSAGIYVDGGKNIIVERNKSYGNGYGIEIGCEELGPTQHITVRDNILFDNEIAGLAIGGYNYPSTGQVLNCTIENNTMYKNDNTLSGNGEIVISKASNCIFKNNVLYTNTQNISISSSYNGLQNNAFNYNAHYVPSAVASNLSFVFNNSTYFGLNNFQSSTSQEMNGIFADPLFVNSNIASPSTVDFSLTSGSLCIDAGAPDHMIISGETDFNYYNRITNSVVDIGAIEYGAVLAGIEKEIGSFPFQLYPNPVTEILTIRNDLSIVIDHMGLYNNLGEELFAINGSSEKISLGQLPRGFYLLKITSGNRSFVQRIIKQ